MSSGSLLLACEAALVPPLGRYGLRVVSSTAHNRGDRVDLANGCLLISVTADWLEGDLDVTISTGGDGPTVPLAELVNVSAARGLSLRRLPRAVTREMLERRLRQIADLLTDQVPQLLDCAPASLESLQ